ncbi:MAG: VOC family protein [Planctomycetota bacterium]
MTSHTTKTSVSDVSVAEPPVRVRQIDHVTLVVRDVEASRRFYVGLLGMTEVARPAFPFDGAWFRAGSTLIHLIHEHERSGPAGYPVEVLVKSSRNHHLAFEVDDARAAAERLKSRGVVLLDDARLRPDGAVQVFLTDPDHHVVELCSSPPWTREDV